MDRTKNRVGFNSSTTYKTFRKLCLPSLTDSEAVAIGMAWEDHIDLHPDLRFWHHVMCTVVFMPEEFAAWRAKRRLLGEGLDT